MCLVTQILEAQTDTINVLDEVIVAAKQHNSIVSETRAQLEGLSKISDVAESLTSAQVKGSGSLKTVSIHNLGANYTTLSIEGVQMSDVQTGQINFSEYSFSDNVELNIISSSNCPQTASSIISSSEFTSSFSRDSLKLTKIGLEGSLFSARTFSLISRRNLLFKVDYSYDSGRFPYSYKNGIEIIRANRTHNNQHNLNAFCEFLKNKWTFLSSVNYNNSQLPGPVIFYTSSGNEHMSKINAFIASKFNSSIENLSFQYLNKVQYLRLFYSDANQIYSTGTYEELHNQFDVLNSGSIKFAKDRFVSVLSTDFTVSTLNSSFEESLNPVRLNSTSALKVKYFFNKFSIEADAGFSNIFDILKNTENVNRLGFSCTAKTSYFPFNSLSLSVAFKRNFRLPTFNDLYYSRTGNRNVQVEKVNQILFHAQYRKNAFQTSSSVYFNNIENKIVTIPQAYIWKTLNAGNCKTFGVDVSASVELKHLEASASYSYAKAIMFDKPIPYAPEHSVYASLIGKLGRFKAMISTRYLSRQYSSFVQDTYSEINNLLDLSVSFAYSFSRFTTLLRISNITNNTNEYVKYYPSETRNIHLCITFNL